MKRFAPIAALVTVVVSLLAAPPAQAATRPTHARVVAVASDAGHVVYKRRVASANLTPQPQKGDELFATDAAGHVAPLTDFDGASYDTVSLVGDFLVQASGGSGQTAQHVRYRNLSTGATAQVTSKTTDALKSAAPDGWVVLRTGQIQPDSQFSLVRVRPDGSETDLGVPFPDYIDGGVGYGLQTSDSGLIAVPIEVDEECTTSQVKFQPWSDPGVWRTVFAGTPRSCIACAPAARSSVACNVFQPNKGLVTISLRGGAPHYVRNSHPKLCQTVDYATSNDDLIAIETTDAGSCTKGLVYRFGQNKKVATSTARYGALGSIRTGLGRILVSKGQQQLIYGLSGVTRNPSTIARA
jgi:hypothetical protein